MRVVSSACEGGQGPVILLRGCRCEPAAAALLGRSSVQRLRRKLASGYMRTGALQRDKRMGSVLNRQRNHEGALAQVPIECMLTQVGG